jgi:hypothetical protein
LKYILKAKRISILNTLFCDWTTGKNASLEAEAEILFQLNPSLYDKCSENINTKHIQLF